MANRLARSTSPYLLQHASNPVDWNPWDEEALARARAEDKPILLSIGYSACHWCHVMERESFEDEEIARLMNAHFVPVKVDREERPDLDDIYMAATLAMNQGQGGWPMTVFLTPDQEPFFAGTYFPPTDRYGRPGFRTVLERIASLWSSDRTGLREQARDLARFLRESVKAAPGLSVGEEELRGALRQLERDFDARWGGFGPAPKFPPSTSLSLLLRGHRRFGEARALEMVEVTLERMARGGMYDQVGGGFHRYSVDERWRVPHFEKMLYDNALLARCYLEGWQATGNAFHQRIAAEILDYVLREMTSPEGGFYSATDADSEGEEGRFFVWTPAEIREAVGDDELGRRFCAYYDVTERGNFEGKSIPNVPEPLADVAAVLGVSPADLEDALATARPLVYAARRLRVPPALDDKIVTAWNGLMVSALAEGQRVLGDERYGTAARRAADFLMGRLATPEGRLLRTYRAGTAHLAGYLEDYAFLSQGLLDLYEATGAEIHLRDALRLARRMSQDFAAEEGGFYATARDHERLLVRPREGHDGATPAANGVAAHVLARLSFHLGDAALREEAARAIRAWGRAIARQPRAFASTLAAVDLLLDGPVEVAIVGAAGDEDRRALVSAVGRTYLPNRIVALHDPGTGPSERPLLAGKGLVEGRAALYVCRDFACRQPVTDPAEVPAALTAPVASDEPPRPRALAAPRRAGRATTEATSALASRSPVAATGYGPLGATGLVCSRIGFGGYRVDDETEAHRAALRRALASGCNLVDTSTNYTDGGSEQLVGAVLDELAGAQTLRREEVIVVSKIGYMQGTNLELAERREADGHPFPDVVKHGEGLWHCIHPEFLADQLARSLQRLRLETLDVCLLHNPEYFLSDAHERSHGSLDKRREEFHRRIGEAFAFLEGEVAAGRLGWYGVSSNTCTRPAGDPEATSLTRMLEAARAAGGEDHHFRVLQLPLNVFESGALLERNNGPSLGRAVLEEAARAGVGVLVNRPLNAMVDESLVRLASPPARSERAGLEEALAALAAREAEYREEIAVHLDAAPGGVPPAEFFRWSVELPGIAPHVRNLEHWESIEQQRVLPRLRRALQVLDQALAGPVAERWHAWRGRYVSEVQEALRAVRARAAEKSRGQADRVASVLDPLLPVERRREPLSRKALWIAASAPGVSSVLVGMRAEPYVTDALGVLGWPRLPDVRPVLERLRGFDPSDAPSDAPSPAP